MPTRTIKQTIFLTESDQGKRIDQALADHFLEYSRSQLTAWLKAGNITVNQKSCLPKQKVLGSEQIDIHVILKDQLSDQPEAIALDIIFEDEEILVINKPIGLVVHPAAGNREGTLLNALLYHDPALKKIPRAGIIHRLDKNTSGLLIIAKTLEAHHDLIQQMQARKIAREYLAIVHGVLTGGGKIETAMGRHPIHRTKMAVKEEGKIAITHYRIIEKFPAHTLILVKLETGRTHQIRVHMAHIHHPILGDPLYGGRMRFPKGASEQLLQLLKSFKHQALHARKLAFMHPKTKQLIEFKAKIPPDFEQLIQLLRTKK